MVIVHPGDDIQALLNEGPDHIHFSKGVYLDAHYTLGRSIHLSGEEAVLVGGVPISWQREGKFLTCSVADRRPMRVLIVNGSLRPRSRWPQEGYLTHESRFEVPWMSSSGGGWKRRPTREELTSLEARGGDLDGLDLHSAEATLLHSWDDSMLTIAKVEGSQVTFAQEGGHPAGAFGVRKWCLWNLPQGLTQPGQFYHDTLAGKLFYWPLPGEDEKTLAYLPTGESILKVTSPISGLEVEGLTFMVTDTPRVSAGFGAYAMTGALEMEAEVTESSFHHLRFDAVGGYAMRSLKAFAGCLVHHLVISDTGAGGLRLGAAKQREKSVVRDSRIMGVGRYYPGAIGLAITSMDAIHNEVAHTSYSALNVAGDGIVVEGNLIHHAMEVLNDGAAVYTIFSESGVMRRNLSFGIGPEGGAHLMRSAYYLDEMTRNWLIEDNAAINCGKPSFSHMSGPHCIRHNFFSNSLGEIRLHLARCQGLTYEDNVMATSGSLVIAAPTEGIAAFKGNKLYAGDRFITEELDHYSTVATHPFVPDHSNSVGFVELPCERSRIFEVGDFRLDLSDIGPRE